MNWTRAAVRIISLAAVAAALPLIAADPANPDLERNFRFPPLQAKARTLWMWMNGNVTADGISRDLQAMQRAGLGGALIFNIGEFIPKGAVDYGGTNWLELMSHAAREAERLGLELAMHNCPGWSSSGGPWVTPEMSMQRLVWSETHVKGGTALEINLPQPFTRLDYYRDICILAFPSLPGEEKPFAEALKAVRSARGSVDKRLLIDTDLATAINASPENPLVLEFAEPFSARAATIHYSSGGATVGFELESSDDGETFAPVATLSPATPRAIEDASLVANFQPVQARFFRITPRRSRGITEVELHAAPRLPDWNFKANHSYRAARPFSVEGDTNRVVIESRSIVNLTTNMNAEGALRWLAPEGQWTIVRFGYTPRGQQNIAAPDSGVGLEIDKMSRSATAFHFEKGLGPLLRALGPKAGKSFTGLEIDSYEVGVQNWTAGFEVAFRELNGYDIHQFLPTMTGRYVDSAETSERFLWDLRRTHAQLVADHYYGGLKDIGNQRGLRLFAEPYGAGPGAYDELQVAGRVDVPMGEFWAHFPWDDMMSIRLAASAAHVQGKSIVAAEAYTATEEQSRFLDYPFGLKATGDLAFSLGCNQIYFHRYAHQPHPTAIPGMTMGPWGFHFDRNNTWFEHSGPWLAYIARSQFLLQQGTFVADVLYFTGEGSPQMSKRITPELPPGYQFDAIDAETLLRSAHVENGTIVLESGARYRVLAMPPDLNAMTPQILRKLHELVTHGAVVAGPKPVHCPTLRGGLASQDEFETLVNTLWNTSDTNGLHISSSPPAELLRDHSIPPDFDFTAENPDADLVWLHRRVKDADIYFVANRQRRDENVVVSFRVEGRQPELWKPESGTIETCAVFEMTSGRTRVPLALKPSESVFVVFRKPAESHVAWVERDGRRIVDASATTQRAVSVPPTNSFTVHAWIKPDTDLMGIPQDGGSVAENGKSWVIPAQPGREANSSVLGIAAGRNGVIVAERNGNNLNALMVHRSPISSWTHVAVTCRGGTTSLFINGRKVREGRAAAGGIRAGYGAAPLPGRTIYYFDGDMTRPQISAGVLSDSAIAELSRRGVPDPALPTGLEMFQAEGRRRANVWSPGRYSLSDGGQLNVLQVPEPRLLSGPWEVAFSGPGKWPDPITMTNLVPLQQHNEPLIRNFAGRATYRQQFELSSDQLAHSGKLWLDLGRVAVIAEVRLNGEWLDPLWRPPFRAEITALVRRGMNDLEIHVNTLLANRLIGDESLPSENEYDPRTRAILAFPEWYSRNQPKPPGRATFSTWRFFQPDDPLVESGLRGPVRILTSVTEEFR
ncbi:MAG TPA: glycosyl hydrolase [Verrucomicrobiae bacterium]|nr:glycosyl hydrolase [Verrucomicrobiae bacterium]